MGEFVYDAFISYSHRDLNWARWVQRRIETFRIPKDVPDQTLVGRHLRVFRDQTDLAGLEVQEALRKELRASRDLIVICSPASAASRWVDDEVRYFRSQGEGRRVIPFFVDGEPESDKPELECYPEALRSDPDWHALGANVKEIGRNKAFLKLMAIILDLRFNRLVDREKQRRRRTALIAGITAGIVVSFSTALIWRNVVVSRRNQVLSYDIYGAALVAISQKENPDAEDVEFLWVSAEAGNTEAMIFLADCLLYGKGTEMDPDQAYYWYCRGAEAGDTVAMIAVANCYFNGTGTEVNLEQSFFWNMQAAEAGNPAGMLNVAICYADGAGVEQNAEEAFHWYRKAAEQGYDLAMYNVAQCYMSGSGTDISPELAFHWMRKLAELGNHEGMYNTGLMYQYGYGTDPDAREAYLWYREAAEAGDADAMYQLAICIENHFGTENEALEWYQRALENGKAEAAAEVERLSEGQG